PMQIELAISNSGFYSEEFMLEYHYSPLFLASVSGPSTALIAPGTVATIPVTIAPHASIPQPGSSPVTVTVRLPGVGISESVTLLFDYREPVFEASEVRLDRHSLLAGQEIRGKLTLLNDGFPTNGLRAEIILLAPSGSESNIWSRNIEELGHGKEFSASFNHTPQQGGLYQLRLKVYQQDQLLYSTITEQDFRVVAGDGDAATEPPALELPRPALNMLALLSFLGLAFYTASSENSRYLSFKLLLPLYTRLRRDTLADEPTRQNLMRYIYVHPGANFTQLRDHFDLHNGTLSHHLNVLENHSVIESFRAGRQRLFYPCRAERAGVVARPLVTGEVQQQIVMLIKEEPGITQSMIATRLDMSRQKVNYHVTALTRQALIRVEPSGRITRLYPLHFT
ncbi:MAG TPA: winged helix-turn-helix transcriptional regulator, partial [Candidatus Poseidoniales archaeon]|nr:winged helix-turn-helix transcriptional regulator [Candidatus Poseidoniales archaeon]